MLLLAQVELSFLWCYQCIQGWILWMDEWVLGSMKWNKALHLISLLKWLDSESLVVGAGAEKELGHCLKSLCAFAEQGKQQYNWSVTKAMNHNQLVAAGAALHNSKWPIFILWLLDCIKHCSEPFWPPLPLLPPLPPLPQLAPTVQVASSI